VTASAPRGERLVACGLLLLCAVCCLVLARGATALELANARRREQLDLLARLSACPQRLQPGPVPELDGLFARRLEVLSTGSGPCLVFRGPASDGGREVARR
jgi:hypothetical protein